MPREKEGLSRVKFASETAQDANVGYAERFIHGHLSNRPRRMTAVLTCMDSRMDPVSFLGVKVGDAHILRNAGGRGTPDVIRSLVVSQRVLGTRDVKPIFNLDSSVREDSEALRNSPVIRRDSRISGYIYDVRSSKLRRIR
jgi:carbonic anhydrase